MLDELGIDRAHLVGNSYGGSCALRLALDTAHRVDRLVLMGPGGIGTTRGLPTAGLKSLLDYYGGDGPSLDKLRTFIRSYLVYDGDAVPESLIQTRYESSIDPEVLANPPLQRPSGLRTLWRMDFTRDRGSPSWRHRHWCSGDATTRSTSLAAQRCWGGGCPTPTSW